MPDGLVLLVLASGVNGTVQTRTFLRKKKRGGDAEIISTELEYGGADMFDAAPPSFGRSQFHPFEDVRVSLGFFCNQISQARWSFLQGIARACVRGKRCKDIKVAPKCSQNSFWGGFRLICRKTWASITLGVPEKRSRGGFVIGDRAAVANPSNQVS